MRPLPSMKATSMKTLLLFRHAKSDWGQPGIDDFDRPLNRRGMRAAPKMGAWIAQAGYRPDLILCSTAKRAMQTLELAAPELDHPRADEPVRVARPIMAREDGLYHASADHLIARIRDIDDACDCVLLVGHNPGLHACAMMLAGHGEADELVRLGRKFPTAAIAVLQFIVSQWSGVREGGGRLASFETPKRLDAERAR